MFSWFLHNVEDYHSNYKNPFFYLGRLDLRRFPFNYNVRFEFSATSSNEWKSIFQNFQKRGQPREVYSNFRIFFFLRKFSFHSFLLLEFLESSAEWFAFRKFNTFRNFWKLFLELSVPFPAVSKFSSVLVELVKRP